MANWSIAVTLDSVDVSSRVLGTIDIDGEASRSRVATFYLLPNSGVVDVGDWIKAPVAIDIIENPGAGQTVTRLFTGKVSTPYYNPVTRIVRFECTDDLQGHAETMTEAQILAAIPGGKYSVPVFGDPEDGWQQMLDVLSTVPQDYDFNADGVTAVLTDWAAKATADFSYNHNHILDTDSVEVELIRLRDLINKVALSVEYRFARLHHREHTFAFIANIPPNTDFVFCDYYSTSYELPTRDMIWAAAEGAGWLVKNNNIAFETLPDTGGYTCNSAPVAWTISEELQNQLVVQASWTAVKRWSQTITETNTLTVQEAGSISKFGESLYEDGAAHETDYDDAGFEASADSDIPTGWAQNAIGDYSQDQLDRTEADNTIETLLQFAQVKILDSHRQNYVSFQVPIEPTLERHHTVEMDSGAVQAKGKAFQVKHSISIDQGIAITHVTIAVSKTGTGGSSDPLTAPTPPDTDPSHTPPDIAHDLPNRIGNTDAASNYDETWQGFTGNFTAAQGTPTAEQIYPRRMRVDTDDIEDESRQETTGERVQTYNVQAPDETLTLSV